MTHRTGNDPFIPNAGTKLADIGMKSVLGGIKIPHKADDRPADENDLSVLPREPLMRCVLPLPSVVGHNKRHGYDYED